MPDLPPDLPRDQERRFVSHLFTRFRNSRQHMTWRTVSKVSRTSVISSYELLHAEGYVDGKLVPGASCPSTSKAGSNSVRPTGFLSRHRTPAPVGSWPAFSPHRQEPAGSAEPTLQYGLLLAGRIEMAVWPRYRRGSSRSTASITSSLPIRVACSSSESRSPNMCGLRGWSTLIPSASSSPQARNRRSTSASAC